MSEKNKLRIVLAIVICLALFVGFLFSRKPAEKAANNTLIPERPLTTEERARLDSSTNATPSATKGTKTPENATTEKNRNTLNNLFNSPQ